MPGDRRTGGRQRLARLISQLRPAERIRIRDRLHRVYANLVLAFQAGIAAALAWIISHKVIGNPEPIFAPIAAIGTLGASVGQRLPRTAELVFGVALGIAAADLLIFTLGTGPWQLGLIVVLAIVVAVFLGAGPGGVIQSAATGVLIVGLTPRHPDLEFSRVIDALVGGFVGLAVIGLLLPLNPLRVVERAARPALNLLADQLEATAQALKHGDAATAQVALDRLRELQERLNHLEEALAGGRETATLAPVRWHRRAALTQYVESAEYIEYAVGNSGALIRRSVTALEDGEPIPPALPSAVSLLAESVRILHRELAGGREAHEARRKAIEAVVRAGEAYGEGVGFSGSVVVAQVRTTASDLIRATGTERTDANRMVRLAFEGQFEGEFEGESEGLSEERPDGSKSDERNGRADERDGCTGKPSAGASRQSRDRMSTTTRHPRRASVSGRGPAPYTG